MLQSSPRYSATAVLATIREQGRSIVWLAGKLGMSRQYTSDVAHGRCVVREDIARRVADALNVPLFLLFNVSDGNKSEHTGENVA